MDRYRSHKIVEAGKIIEIRPTELQLVFKDNAGVTVSASYMHKHKPQVGGYYVLYDDGYQSWSPAEAFETGYTKVVDPLAGMTQSPPEAD